MGIDRTKYNKIAFYSGFAYLRQVGSTVTVTSHDSGWGSQLVDGTVFAIPAEVTTLPPVVRYYIEYDGKMHTQSAADGINVGWDNYNIYVDGMNNNAWNYSDVFKVHLIIQDRAANGT